jgi:hypothetical protein
MTINTINKLETGLDSRFIRLTASKATLLNLTAGQFASLWRATGNPAQAAIPTTGAVVSNLTLGAHGTLNPVGADNLYFGGLEISCSTGGTTVELHDRLAHSGGLSGTTTTSQTGAQFDLSILTGSNLVERIGDTNYSDVLWWLEIYTDIGATGATATVNVTYDNGTTGNLTNFTLGNTVRRAGTMFPLNSLIPALNSGRYIRGINSIIHATTGTAGNYGFTATRYRCGGYAPLANQNYKLGWPELGLPQIYDSSALFGVVLTPTTATGTINYYTKIIYG